MRRNTQLFSRRNERGSTILEVMVALFILSTLGIGAWYAGGVSLRLAGRVRNALATNTRLLQIDDVLLGLAARVYLPYWAPEGIVQVGDQALSVPYLDGDQHRALNMTFQHGILSIGDGEVSSHYAGFRRVELSPATDGALHQYGVSVTLEGNDGKHTVIVARFGATPLGSISSQ